MMTTNKYEQRWIMVHDIICLQAGYHTLVKSERMTKKDIVDLCVPFKQKYAGLSDIEILNIARSYYSLERIVTLIEDTIK